MKNLDSSLLLFDIASIGFGYRALNELTLHGGPRVLDASPVGSRFFIMLAGEREALAAAAKRVRALADGADAGVVVDSELIDICEPSVRDAFFALNVTTLEESLVVVECETLSACFAAAQALVHDHGLKAIELRALRSSTGGAYGFFTGEKSAALGGAEDVRSRLTAKLRKGRVETIASPTHEVRRHFNLSGEN